MSSSPMLLAVLLLSPWWALPAVDTPEQIVFSYQFEQRHLGRKSRVLQREIIFEGNALAGLAELLTERSRGQLSRQGAVARVEVPRPFDAMQLIDSLRGDTSLLVQGRAGGGYRIDRRSTTIVPLSDSSRIARIVQPPGRAELWTWTPSHALRVWSLTDWSFVAERHSIVPYISRFATDENALWSTGMDSQLRCWDPSGRRVIRAVKTSRSGLRVQGGVNDLAVTADGERVALAHSRGEITIYQTKDLKKLLGWAGTTPGRGDADLIPEGLPHANQDAPGQLVMAVSFTPDGTLLASGGIDWALHFWNPATGALTSRHPATRRPLRRLWFLAEGNHLVSVDRAGVAVVWAATVTTGSMAERWAKAPTRHTDFRMHERAFSQAQIAANHDRLAFVNPDAHIEVRALPTGDILWTSPMAVQSISTALCWLADGRLVVGAGADGKPDACHVVDTTTGTLVALPSEVPYLPVLQSHPERHRFTRQVDQGVQARPWQARPESQAATPPVGGVDLSVKKRKTGKTKKKKRGKATSAEKPESAGSDF